MFSCPPGDTLACIEELPAPVPDLLTVLTECPTDYDGNPLPPTQGSGSGSQGSSSGGPGTGEVCDSTMAGCYDLWATVLTRDSTANTTRVEVIICYRDEQPCKHAVSHVAFSLPEGLVATDHQDGGTYEGELGNYHIENTTNNPYYSIKFESLSDGFSPGACETFVYTVPDATAYLNEDVAVRLKAGRVIDDTVLSLDCVDAGSTVADSTVVNYQINWDFDYIIPGSSGCTGDPIRILRSYSASDACGNSSFCEQEFLVESPCVDGVPTGCDQDSIWQPVGSNARTVLPSSLIWQPEANQYAAQFAGTDETATGYYSISRIQPTNIELADEAQEIGRLAPSGQETYTFAHRNLGNYDSLIVQWVGPTNMTSSLGEAPLRDGLYFKAFPNPGDDELLVRLERPLDRAAQLSVVDGLGRTMHSATIAQGEQGARVNSREWMSGLYYLRIDVNGLNLARRTWIKR